LYVVGGLQHESLFPTTDVSGDRTSPRSDWAKIDHLSNTYLDLGLRYDYGQENKMGFNGLSVTTRTELTQWPMLGYESGFAGHGLAHLDANFDFKWGSVTVGDVYGQFGSGLILRLYEERSLGIDNALRGGKVIVRPYQGIHLEVLGGKQRRYWNMYDDGAWGFGYGRDAAMGANVELQVNEWSPRMQDAGANLTIGASYVSKYEAMDTVQFGCPAGYMLNLPQWVGAGDVRANFQMAGWNALIEYAYKANDPCVSNKYSYDPGQALLASLSYSQKGMSIIAQVKRSENMYFRSERGRNGSAGMLNHLPAFANQHTYALAALHPYATQMDGEWAFQGELRYTFARKTRMGGKYGTTFKLNGSHVRGLGNGFFGMTKDAYYTDVNLELNKKITKEWYIAAMLMYQTYNKAVVEEGVRGAVDKDDLVRSGIGVVDVKWATTKDVQMRAELQYLFSKQDEGQWIFALYELSLFKQLMLSVQEQYCIGHGAAGATEQGKHYYSFLATWQRGAHRVSAGYTKTRAGFNCSGGVCRYVPKQEGVTLTYNFTW